MRALVTGASAGIGKALAPLFAADKHDLVLVARRKDLLEQSKAELTQRFGVRVDVLAEDLAQTGAAERVFAFTKERGVDVDILVNNAGFGMYGMFDEQSLEKQREMIALNVTALTELTRLFVEPMKARSRGRILQVASTAAFQPGPRMAVYYATKAYVLSFSEALAQELLGTGVTMTTLCPGPTKSEFMAVANYRMQAMFERGMMTSDEVAKIGYRALMGGERLAVAGAANKLMTVTSQLAPRGLVLAVADKLIRSRS